MIGCISVFFCRERRFEQLRSPYLHDRSYFCLVDRNGIANYDSANNANGVAPDFATQKLEQVNHSSLKKVNNDLCERRDTSCDESPKQPSDADARTLLAWWEDIVLNLISCVLAKQFSRTRFHNCTEGEQL